MEGVRDKDNCSDEPAVPYKKIRREFSSKTGPERNKHLICYSKSEDSPQLLNDIDIQSPITEPNLNIGRHHRFNSIEQDDVQSSSGNSSNLETENTNEDDSGNVSDSSSHASSGDWQSRPSGMFAWVQEQMITGVDPREVLQQIVPSITDHLPSDVSPLSLWKLVVNILNEPERRPKLPEINTLSNVVNLIKNAKNILVLTGAGVSVSCGIPDFRSRDGIYARLAVDFPDLPDPQAMFDISYFMRDPRPFFKFAKEIYPGQFKPSRGHRFISLLQKTGRLLRNYTQNIDTLEQVAGISRVIQCHGSFATASCLNCHHKVDCEAVREDIFNQKVPRCPICSPEEELGIMKPDIVFFGESLPEHFHRQMSKDKHDTDLLIVIGSSLKVRPVALIPSSLPNDIPQILINREPLPHVQFDVELLGDGDAIVAELCRRLGDDFLEIAEEREKLTEIDCLPGDSSSSSSPQVQSSSQSQSMTCEDDSDKNNNLSPDSGKHSETDENSSLPDNDNTKSEIVNDSITTTKIKHEEDLKSKSDEAHCSQQSVASKTASTSDSEKQSDSDKVKETGSSKMQFMWKSRWKQSISKRLPAGTFHYDGKSRYIFPGAEVAPEEDDDDDESDSSDDDYEDNPSNTKDDSSDESEDELTGPGGLSSTRRDLRTTTSAIRSNHRHHFPNIASTSYHSHSDILMHHIHTDDEDDDTTLTEDQALMNISKGDDSESLITTTQPSTISEESKNIVTENQKSDSIIPDELHELITLGEVSSLPGNRLHSPLPENLHKILTNEPLHSDKSDVLLAKSDIDIPDTAEILELPSSSLLPPINEYEANSVENKS